MEYAVADKRHQFRIAAENPASIDVSLLQQESGRRVLIIGEFLNSNKLLS